MSPPEQDVEPMLEGNASQARMPLDVPPAWKLVAYLCLGYPDEERDRPELETEGWAARLTTDAIVIRR